MPQEIYNEGRVVGLSAWEIFKRNALGNGVLEKDIPTEPQWLTAMIGAGSSVILKISATDPNNAYTKGVHDFELPVGSNLSAAGVIVANPFMGTCEWDAIDAAYSGWATKVTSYSPLIQNTSSSSPTSSNVPFDANYNGSDYNACVTEFVKITDGIVFTKQATWIPRSDVGVFYDFGDGTTTTFPLSQVDSVISITDVHIDGSVVDTSEYRLDNTVTPNVIIFNVAPEDDSQITVNYRKVADTSPVKDINPDFNNSTTVVRLYLNADLTRDVYILLTGFTNKRILQGVSGYADDNNGYSIGGSTDITSNDWCNGGMLGPEIIPWASKIIFSVPSSAYNLANSLTRRIPVTTPDDPAIPDGTKFGYTFSNLDSTIKPNSVIDFNSIRLTQYYDKHGLGSETIKEKVSGLSLGINDAYNTAVAWYPGMTATKLQDIGTSELDIFPPALYAAQVTQDGGQTLVPLDVAAPGTVKGFTDDTQAYHYKQLMQNNFAFYHNVQNGTVSFALPNEPNSEKWLGLSKLEYLTENPKVQLTAANNVAQFVALTKPNSTIGNLTLYDTTGSVGTISVGPNKDLTWKNLLDALAQEKKIDVLGDKLHQVGTELTSASNSIGITNEITKIGADNLSLTGANQTITFTGTGDQTTFEFGTVAAPIYVANITSVKIDDVDISSENYTLNNSVTPNTITFKTGAPADSASIVVNYGIEYVRVTRTVNSDDPSTSLATLSVGTSIKSGTNFIEFSNGKRLYIDTSAPATANVPIGSIGIGW